MFPCKYTKLILKYKENDSGVSQSSMIWSKQTNSYWFKPYTKLSTQYEYNKPTQPIQCNNCNIVLKRSPTPITPTPQSSTLPQKPVTKMFKSCSKVQPETLPSAPATLTLTYLTYLSANTNPTAKRDSGSFTTNKI